MTYELIQAALTNLINVTAIAGFTGIIAHAFWKQHTTWMAEYCPAVGGYTRDTQVEVEPELIQPQVTEVPVIVEAQPIDEDVWEGKVEPTQLCFRPVSRHFSPQLALPAAKEELKPKKSRKTPASPKAPAKSRTTRPRKVA